VLKEHLYSEPAALRVELVFHSAVIDTPLQMRARCLASFFFDLVELARMRKIHL
jgi:hypothetical protein